jgi:hypothetical protein
VPSDSAARRPLEYAPSAQPQRALVGVLAGQQQPTMHRLAEQIEHRRASARRNV